MAEITFFDAPQVVNETTNDYGTDFHYLFCVGYIGRDDNKGDVYAAMSGYVKDYDYKETGYEDYSAVVYNDDEGKCYTTDAQGNETYYPLPQEMLDKLNAATVEAVKSTECEKLRAELYDTYKEGYEDGTELGSDLSLKDDTDKDTDPISHTIMSFDEWLERAYPDEGYFVGHVDEEMAKFLCENDPLINLDYIELYQKSISPLFTLTTEDLEMIEGNPEEKVFEYADTGDFYGHMDEIISRSARPDLLSEMCEKYRHLGTLFTDLRDCADAIRARRVRQGAIDFDTPEAEIKVDGNGVPYDVVLRQRGHAERMIEDCMIAANCAVANEMKRADVPCVYRIHEVPEAKRIKTFIRTSAVLGHRFIMRKSTIHPKEFQTYLDGLKDEPEYPVLSMMMLRTMQKAKYDPSCIGHFGLAEKEYLHFTSPIRRYPDLIVHRMLRKYIYEGCTDESEINKDEALMVDYSEQSSIRERASQDAEYDCDDMKKAQYMEKFVGDTFTGIISGVTGFGFYVELPNTIEGMVRLNDLHDDFYVFNEDRMELQGQRTRRVFRIGMEVKVICAGTTKALGQVDFMIANAARPAHDYRKGKGNWNRSRSSEHNRGYDSRRKRYSSSRHSYSNGRRK